MLSSMWVYLTVVVDDLHPAQVIIQLGHSLLNTFEIGVLRSAFDGRTKFRDCIKPISPPYSLHAVADDPHLIQIILCHALLYGDNILLPVFQESRYKIRQIRIDMDNDRFRHRSLLLLLFAR